MGLASGEFQSGEELAGRLRMRVGRAYREGRLDCSLVSDLHHFFEVEFANRVYAWEDVPVGEEEEEDDIVEAMEEEEGMICENFSRGSSSNHFMKSFQNIGIFGNHQLEP